MIGRFQPDIGRRLSGHPITDKLVMAVNFAKQDTDLSGSPAVIIPEDTEVAGPGFWQRGNVVYALGTNRYGTWAGFGAAALNSFFSWSRSDFIPTGPCTVLLLYEKADATPRASAAFTLNFADGGGFAPRILVTLPFSDGVVYFDYGGVVEGTSRLSVGGLTFGADRWVFSTGGRGMEIWQNGIKRASNSGNPTRTTSVATPFVLGAKTADSLFSDIAHYNLFAMWARQLTTEEILTVSADPYMLWDSPSVFENYVLLAAAGAGAGIGGAHPVARITQLVPAGIPGRRYGSFAGKAGTGPTFQTVWARNANALVGAGKIG